MSVSESCPYCGKMTPMVKKNGRWVSGTCEHCKKDISAETLNFPVREEDKPSMKAPDGVLP